MAYTKPTLQQIQARVIGDIEASVGQTTPILAKALLRVLGKVFAGVVYLIYGFGSWVIRQMFIDSAESEYLERLAKIYGITRKPAAFASGKITFTGSNGSVIPVGTAVLGGNNVEYETTAEGAISAGTVDIAVVSTIAGLIGNLATGSAAALVSPIAGVDTACTVSVREITDGTETETDDELRARVILRVQYPPHGGNEEDFENWALSIYGVTRAWAYGNWVGAGTVGLTFVMDNQTPSIIPDAAKVLEVQNYLDQPDIKPICANVIVFAPAAVTVNFTIAVNPNTAPVKAAVEAELKAYLSTYGAPGSTLYLSQINAAISGATGEISHVMTAPIANITIANNEVAEFGSITWS